MELHGRRLGLLTASLLALGAPPSAADTRASSTPSKAMPAPLFALPDLVVEKVQTVQLGSCQSNGTRKLTIMIIIRNVGGGPAIRANAKYAWVRAQAVVDGVPLNQSSAAAGNVLGAGQSVPFSVTVTVKGSASTHPGAKEEGAVLVTVDPDSVMKEVNEANNTVTFPWYASTACASP
jgi:subtilase family serine protease